MICFFASPATGEVVAAIEDADFNQDGNVDGNDFLTWQRGFGATGASHSDGDANYDTNVDMTDLSIWESQFGTTVGRVLAASAVVPEPSTIALAFFGLIVCRMHSRF